MSEVAVARTGAGASDAERFDAFVAARGDALWRSAWLLTGDRHLAEDLVQTALAKSWPKWPGDRRGGPVRGLCPAEPVHDVRRLVAAQVERRAPHRATTRAIGLRR